MIIQLFMNLYVGNIHGVPNAVTATATTKGIDVMCK